MGNARPKGTIYMAAQRGKPGQKLSSSSASSPSSRRGSSTSTSSVKREGKKTKKGKKASKVQHQSPQPPGETDQESPAAQRHSPPTHAIPPPSQTEVPMPATLDVPGEEPKVVLIPDQSRMGQKHDRKGMARIGAGKRTTKAVEYEEQLEGTPVAAPPVEPSPSMKRTRFSGCGVRPRTR